MKIPDMKHEKLSMLAFETRGEMGKVARQRRIYIHGEREAGPVPESWKRVFP